MDDSRICPVLSSLGHVCNAHCGGVLHASLVYSAARGPNEVCALWDWMADKLHQDTHAVCARWAEVPEYAGAHGWLIYWTEGTR